MAVEVRATTIAELELQPNIGEILAEYASESAILGLPHPAAKASTYKNLEGLGTLRAFGAFSSGLLIGYICVLLPVLPHYDKMIAVSESFFVLSAHRKGGAGLKLLRAAERFAAERGSPGFLVSAPLFGDLCDVLPHVGYAPTSCVFFKNFAAPAARLPKMTLQQVTKVSALETAMKQLMQVEIETKHVLHAGMYSRTVRIPAGVMITGALIKIPTMIVVEGSVTVYVGDETLKLDGYNVVPALAGRKQVFYAHVDSYLTMLFPTAAETVDEAEEEFTDEAHLLSSRQGVLDYSSGEQKCLA